MKDLFESIEVLGFWRTVWGRLFYRRVMKLAHKLDWHHAPMHGPFEDGATQRWCQWCGFRETYQPSEERKRLRQLYNQLKDNQELSSKTVYQTNDTV